MNDIQIKIVKAIQSGLILSKEPYKEIAESVGISQQELLAQLREWKRDGTIRRMGAVLRHHSAGFIVNAMGAWNVPNEKVDEFAHVAVEYGMISHCYQRPRLKDFDYNVYTMIHGKSKDDCEGVAEEVSERAGITEYTLLYTTHEFKKTSPEYFREVE